MKQFTVNIYDHEFFDFTPYNGKIDQELVRSMKHVAVSGIPQLDDLFAEVRVYAVTLTFHDATDAFKFEMAYDKPFQDADSKDPTLAGVWEKLSGDQIQSAREHFARINRTDD